MTSYNAGPVENLVSGEGTRVSADLTGHRDDIALFRTETGEVFALDDTCSHAQASLSEGWVEDDQVECPLHSACFSLRTGAALALPATRPVAAHRVEIADGNAVIHIGDTP